MKITVFNGAMRGEKSISHLMVSEFLAGAEGAGAEVEEVLLVKRKINLCRACLSCWIKTPGRCCQRDDMNELLEKYMASEIVVIATPLYGDCVSGLTKMFMDRLIPISDPHFKPDVEGETGHEMRYERYPDMVVISNCGYPEQSHFQVLQLLFRRIARNANCKLIAEIYRGGGGLLGQYPPMLEPMIEEYRSQLRKAGAEVVTDRAIAAETQEALERQMVPTEMYISEINKLWDRLLEDDAE